MDLIGSRIGGNLHDDEPYGPMLPCKKLPTKDIYGAFKACDMEFCKWLLDLGVNINSQDAWDSIALYYICLAGHLDATHMLLENGAICSENTFDGDYCHSIALKLHLTVFFERPSVQRIRFYESKMSFGQEKRVVAMSLLEVQSWNVTFDDCLP